MPNIGRILRTDRPPAILLVASLLAGATATKGGHGMLAAGGALSFYPVYVLTIVICSLVARLRVRFLTWRDSE